MEYGRAGGGIEALAMAKLIYITEDDDNIRELLHPGILWVPGPVL